MKFFIPDHTGHSTEVFDRSSKAELAKAEACKGELVNGDKLTPAVKTGKGNHGGQPDVRPVRRHP